MFLVVSLSAFVLRFSSFVCCFICIVSMLSLFVLCFSLFCFDVRFLRFHFCFLCCQCVCCWVGEKACFVSRTAFVCILLFSLTLLRCFFVSRMVFVCYFAFFGSVAVFFCVKNGFCLLFCFLRFCCGVFCVKNGSRVLFCSLSDSVGVVLGLRLLSLLCLFWLCFARVSRFLNKNGLKTSECFAFCFFLV